MRKIRAHVIRFSRAVANWNANYKSDTPCAVVEKIRKRIGISTRDGSNYGRRELTVIEQQRVTAQSCIAQRSSQIELWFQVIRSKSGVQLVAFNIRLQRFQIRIVGKSPLDGLLFVHADGTYHGFIGRNNFRCRICKLVRSEHNGLQQIVEILDRGFYRNDSFFSRSYFCFCNYDFQRSHGSNFHLLFVVFVKILRGGKRLLVHGQLPARMNKIPVNLFDLQSNVLHALLQTEVRCDPVLLRNAQRCQRNVPSKTTQERLCNVRKQSRIKSRIDARK